MELGEHSLEVLGLVLLMGLFAPELLRRLHLPFASSLIVVGSALGPHGLGYVTTNPTLLLIGSLGAAFHMLLAGFEAHGLDLRVWGRDTLVLLLCTGILPGALGGAIGFALGGDWRAALLVATIFLSSSVMLSFAFLKHFRLENEEMGQHLKSTVVLLELASALLVFVLLKSIAPHHRFPLPILTGLVLSATVILRMFLPEIVAFISSWTVREEDEAFEPQLRLILAIMLVSLFVLSSIDVHPIIAAFLVGFSLASIEHASALRDKLHTVGYAIFIPTFLFVVGLEVDLRILAKLDPRNLLIAVIVVGAIGSKVVGGYIGARLVGLPSRESVFFGVAAAPKFAVPLTATYAALKAGIATDELLVAIVLVTLVTSVGSPLVMAVLSKRTGEGDA